MTASEGMNKKQLGHNQVNHPVVSLVASDSPVGSDASESPMLTQHWDLFPYSCGATPVPMMDSACRKTSSERSGVHEDGQKINQSKQKWGRRAGNGRRKQNTWVLDDSDGDTHLADRR